MVGGLLFPSLIKFLVTPLSFAFLSRQEYIGVFQDYLSGNSLANMV